MSVAWWLQEKRNQEEELGRESQKRVYRVLCFRVGIRIEMVLSERGRRPRSIALRNGQGRLERGPRINRRATRRPH